MRNFINWDGDRNPPFQQAFFLYGVSFLTIFQSTKMSMKHFPLELQLFIILKFDIFCIYCQRYK